MFRSAAVSAVAFLIFASPSLAQETLTPAGRPVAALIGERSVDPSAQPLIIELENCASSEPVVVPAWSPVMQGALYVPGPYGAWDLDAPSPRSAVRFSMSGAFPENAAARFDASPIRVLPRLAA